MTERAPGAIVKAGTVGIVTAFLLAFMLMWEGDSLRPYQDVVGVWTVCMGVTNAAAPGWVVPGRTYTKAECRAKEAEIINQLLAPDIARLVKVDVTQRQWEMLVDFVWNEGSSNFAKSGLLRKLNGGDCTGAAEAFDAWVYAGGRKYKGLVNRRDAEQAEFVEWCAQ